MTKSEKSKSALSKKTVICISGLAGTGKSTLAKKLAKKFKLRYYSGGDALRELAAKKGYKSSSRGWWESPEGLSFLNEREKNAKFDKEVDDKLLQYAQKGRVLLDSWTMPWLLEEGFKVWLLASREKRAERIAKRDRISTEKALQMLKEKDARTKAIYERLYGFSLGEDFEPFNLVLDTDNLSADEVFDVLCTVIKNLVVNKKN